MEVSLINAHYVYLVRIAKKKQIFVDFSHVFDHSEIYMWNVVWKSTFTILSCTSGHFSSTAAQGGSVV